MGENILDVRGTSFQCKRLNAKCKTKSVGKMKINSRVTGGGGGGRDDCVCLRTEGETSTPRDKTRKFERASRCRVTLIYTFRLCVWFWPRQRGWRRAGSKRWQQTKQRSFVSLTPEARREGTAGREGGGGWKVEIRASRLFSVHGAILPAARERATKYFTTLSGARGRGSRALITTRASFAARLFRKGLVSFPFRSHPSARIVSTLLFVAVKRSG